MSSIFRSFWKTTVIQIVVVKLASGMTSLFLVCSDDCSHSCNFLTTLSKTHFLYIIINSHELLSEQKIPRVIKKAKYAIIAAMKKETFVGPISINSKGI